MNTETYKQMCYDVATESISGVVAKIWNWIVEKIKSLLQWMGLMKKESAYVSSVYIKQAKTLTQRVAKARGVTSTADWVWSELDPVYVNEVGGVISIGLHEITRKMQFRYGNVVTNTDTLDRLTPEIVRLAKENKADELRNLITDNTLASTITWLGSETKRKETFPDGSVLTITLNPSKTTSHSAFEYDTSKKPQFDKETRTVRMFPISEISSSVYNLQTIFKKKESAISNERLLKRIGDLVQTKKNEPATPESEVIAGLLTQLINTVTVYQRLEQAIYKMAVRMMKELDRMLAEGYEGKEVATESCIHEVDLLIYDAAIESKEPGILARIWNWIVEKLKAFASWLGLRKRTAKEELKAAKQETESLKEQVAKAKGKLASDSTWVWGKQNPFYYNAHGEIIKGNELDAQFKEILRVYKALNGIDGKAEGLAKALITHVEAKKIDAVNNAVDLLIDLYFKEICASVKVFTLPTGNVIKRNDDNIELIRGKGSVTDNKLSTSTPSIAVIDNAVTTMDLIDKESDTLYGVASTGIDKAINSLTKYAATANVDNATSDEIEIAKAVQRYVVLLNLMNKIADQYRSADVSATREVKRILKERYT
jgi:hypothetical protein